MTYSSEGCLEANLRNAARQAKSQQGRHYLQICYLAVAGDLRMDVRKLMSPRSRRDTAWRAFAVHLAHTVLQVSLSEIGRILGMEKSSVHRMVTSAEDRLDDIDMAGRYDRITEILHLLCEEKATA